MKLAANNINIRDEALLLTPEQLKTELPLSAKLVEQIDGFRKEIADIIHGRDDRKLIVIGPCSIHDPKAAIEYARKLKALSDKVSDKLFLVMRVYFEKPRTTIGWKGLINDPNLDGSFDIEKGLRISRQLCLEIAKIGIPLAAEALDPMTPQYLMDLFSWAAIGARTT